MNYRFDTVVPTAQLSALVKLAFSKSAIDLWLSLSQGLEMSSGDISITLHPCHTLTKSCVAREVPGASVLLLVVDISDPVID